MGLFKFISDRRAFLVSQSHCAPTGPAHALLRCSFSTAKAGAAVELLLAFIACRKCVRSAVFIAPKNGAKHRREEQRKRRCDHLLHVHTAQALTAPLSILTSTEYGSQIAKR